MTTLRLYWYMINAAALFLCGYDKNRAKRGKWRVPEETLILSSVLGGSGGFLLGMLLFRHKTQHKKFTVTVPLLFLLQMALDLWLRRPDWLMTILYLFR